VAEASGPKHRPWWYLDGSQTPEEERAIIARRVRQIGLEARTRPADLSRVRPPRGRAPRQANNAPRRRTPEGGPQKETARDGPSPDDPHLQPQLPLDVGHLANLLAHQRAALYSELDLDPEQRAAAEEGVRAAIRRRYRGAA
jgi:hypothetical protein